MCLFLYKGGEKMYKINEKYFDKIDCENKAYWLGFLWADGYISKRVRGNYNRLEYSLKLSVSEIDDAHLKKFIQDLSSDYLIHYYKTNSQSFSTNKREARVLITNKYMVSNLYENFGIMPNRYNPDELIKNIPKQYHKAFIRGVFDGDGSLTLYLHKGKYKKMNVSFGGSEELLRFIESHLNDNLLHTNMMHKPYRRHKERDGNWRTLSYAGCRQGMKIIDYLYKDATIYLDRKYEKYLNYKEST